MFERFTERARQVVVLAQEEARILKHNYIGTEHILLGLLREEDGIAASVLNRQGITLERVREQIVRIVGSGEGPVSGQIPFTPRAKKLLELALKESIVRVLAAHLRGARELPAYRTASRSAQRAQSGWEFYTAGARTMLKLTRRVERPVVTT